MFIRWASTSLLFLELIKKIKKMGGTLVFNIGHYGEMNKSFFLETTNMIDYWMEMNRDNNGFPTRRDTYRSLFLY
jgi:penicillin-binding protein-related factor A (putative recombinase)